MLQAESMIAKKAIVVIRLMFLIIGFLKQSVSGYFCRVHQRFQTVCLPP